FNPLLQMASGVYLTFFGSFVFGTPEFPLSDVPLQQIAAQVAAGRLKAKPTRVFRFDEIREAHRVMEANEAGGKMVVVHDRAAVKPQCSTAGGDACRAVQVPQRPGAIGLRHALRSGGAGGATCKGR